MRDDDFLLEDGPAIEDCLPSGPPWVVLVTDDDPDVVAVTRAVLHDCRFENRDIELLAAFSAAEARRLLESRPEIAVIVLDVCMETDDAGLSLVTAIRDELHLQALRIILRTGQPGIAPEREVIQQYDINDYRLKSELTAHSLYTTVVAALRGYAEIKARICAEQEALLAARSKSQFMASMSHELRTPLNAIIGFADMMVHQCQSAAGVPPRHMEYATAVRDNGRRLLEVLNALLDMAAIDSGRYELREQVVEVEALLLASVSAASERAAAAGVTIAVHPSEAVSLLVADNPALRQVLDNLLSNAIKFSPAGGAVELWAELGADGRPEIKVVDHGIGIPADRLRDLFQPFSQLDAGLNRHYEGIGLGLSIVKGLVQLHGGTVEIASVASEGTTVTVCLPAERLIVRG